LSILQALEEAAVATGVAGDARLMPSWVTLSSTTSLSQSSRMSCTCCTWPDSSPLNQSLLRERLKYTARLSSAVFCSASRFIQANISTSPVAFSCAITGTRPCASHLI